MRLPVEWIVEKYKDALFRAAFSVCRNQADAQDAVQNTYYKYMQSQTDFESEAHIRSWLFRVVFNQAKDIQRSFWKRNKVDLVKVVNAYHPTPSKERNLFEAVLSLPEHERIILQLYYYEGYSTREIAQILEIKEATTRKRLSRARNTLKQKIKEDLE